MTDPQDTSNLDLDALELELEQSDPADAPEVAEEIARRLGASLDGVDGGTGTGGS